MVGKNESWEFTQAKSLSSFEFPLHYSSCFAHFCHCLLCLVPLQRLILTGANNCNKQLYAERKIIFLNTNPHCFPNTGLMQAFIFYFRLSRSAVQSWYFLALPPCSQNLLDSFCMEFVCCLHASIAVHQILQQFPSQYCSSDELLAPNYPSN